jgi:hypothetical protein
VVRGVVVVDVGDGGVGEFAVECVAVGDAAAEEFGPWWYGDVGVGRFGEEFPELRVVPAEVVGGAVAVGADGGAEASDLGE